MARKDPPPMMGINLHLYPSTIEYESRLMRMTGSIADAGLFSRVDIVGTGGPNLPTLEVVDATRNIVRIPARPGLSRLGGPGRILELLDWNRRITQRYRHQTVSMVNPHIVWALPAAAWFQRHHGARLVYDTHELETETVGSRGLRRALSRAIEKRWIGRADAINVVSDGIADWYRSHYGLKNVHTIKNYPLGGDPRQPTRAFRDRFGIADHDFVFCYQGRLSRAREIELLLEVFRQVPTDRHLVIMGFGPLASFLDSVATEVPNIHFMPGVPFDQVPRYTGSADAALVLFEDTCLSYRHVLPNKLLESLSAGVPAIVSRLPDMVAEISGDDAGWSTDHRIESLAGLIARLDHAEIARKKAGALAWSDRNRWEGEARRMLEVERRLLQR